MVFLNVTAQFQTLSCLTYHSAKPRFLLPFSGLGQGGGGGEILDKILIFPLLKNEERNVLGMEETVFKADHSQHGNYQKPTGRLRIYAPKIIYLFWVAEKRKKEVLEKKKEVSIKVSFSVRWGFGCLMRGH